MSKKTLKNRFLDELPASGTVPTRMDQPLPSSDIWLKSGVGNTMDIPLLKIATVQHLDGTTISPIVGPGHFYIKRAWNFLMPDDSIVAMPFDISTMPGALTLDLIELPAPGMPIIVQIMSRYVGKYIMPIKQYNHVTEFSTKIVNGVETTPMTDYEYIVDYENKKMYITPVQTEFDARLPVELWNQKTADNIKQYGELLGTGTGKTVQMFKTSYLPIDPSSILVYTIKRGTTNVIPWLLVRDLTKHQGERACQAMPEFGIITFGHPEMNLEVPTMDDEIYILYNVVPKVEYVPESSSMTHCASYIDMAPESSGITKGIVQISNADALTVTSLKLTSSAPILDIGAKIYGPLQVALDSADLTCHASNIFDEPVQGVKIKWHFNPDIGFINGNTNADELITITNFNGDTITAYATPLTTEPLETRFNNDDIRVTTDGAMRLFQSNKFNIYDKNYTLTFLAYSNTDKMVRVDHGGRGLKKLVKWETVISENGNDIKQATLIRPAQYLPLTKQLGYLNEVRPPHQLYPDWSEIYANGSVEIGQKVKIPGSISLYAECIGGDTSHVSDSPPVWELFEGAISTDGFTYWETKESHWEGWTIYTDRLVEVYCTAENQITGDTIISNSIYLDIIVPYSWLGLFGFRFDTLIESKMDFDPLTI